MRRNDKGDLTVREARFVASYMVNRSPLKAFKEAGYKGDKKQEAQKVLNRTPVQKEIARRTRELVEANPLIFDEIMERLTTIARTAINQETGEVYIEDDLSSPNLAINKMRFPDGRYIEIVPRHRILVEFARHFGAFSRKPAVKEEVSVVDEYDEARRRLEAYRKSLGDASTGIDLDFGLIEGC